MDNGASLRFEVLATMKDYIDLWRAGPVRFLFWVILGPVAAYYVYWTYIVLTCYGYSPETASLVHSYLFVILVALFGIVVVPRLRARLAFSGPIFREPRTYLFNQEGAHCESRLFNGSYQWSSFTSIKETKRSFVLFVSPVTGMLVPKRCLGTIENVTQVRSMIDQNFQGKKSLRR